MLIETRNKLGTTKVQPGAQSAAGAVGTEVKSAVFLRKLKKPCKTAKNSVLL